VSEETAVERVGRALAAIEAASGLGAFWVIDAEGALDRARELDEVAARGDRAGRLHGQLVAWKDCFDVAGLPTTAGAPWRDGRRRARRHADAVRLFEQEGAITLGKLAMTQLAWGMTGQSPGRDPCRNPHDRSRIPGGSSSGSAVAVSAGLVDHAPGTDSGGSIRQPAALCGVVGFKPTPGSIGLRGCMPCTPSFDTAGPIARSVAEAATAFAVLAGGAPARGTREPGGLRFGVLLDDFIVDGTTAPLIEPVLRLAGELGARRLTLGWSRAHDAALHRVYAAEGAALVLPHDRAPASDRYCAALLADVAVGARLPRRALRAAHVVLGEARAVCTRALDGVDVVLAPTTPVEALRLGEPADSLLLGRLTRPFNALGWPAISIPCGSTPDGLPIGLQLAATAGRDADVLAAAAVVERLIGRRSG
jgi:aspartyl-tRNA(Asn)/glutamyl-tRNA(Gln) amidotransferase subunit A